jgi:putative endonuclease
MEGHPCVYVLASHRNGTIYIGVTSDLMARLHKHRTGSDPGFTRKYAVGLLVRFEMFDDMNAAIAREKQLKRWRGEWKLNLIEHDNPDWDDLAVGWGFDPIVTR